MRLEEIMSRHVMSVPRHEVADAAWSRMREHRMHHLVVLDGREVIGVLSDRDLGAGKGSALRRGKVVEELMSREVVVAAPDMTVREAANRMRGHGIGCLPVLSRGKLVGIVTTTDLLELIGSRGTGAVGRGPKPSRIKPVRRSQREIHSRGIR
jgi:acetoin utilization protein AcuB